MNRDFYMGLFVGGSISLVIAVIMSIWNLLGMAPLVMIILFDLALGINIFIENYGKS